MALAIITLESTDSIGIVNFHRIVHGATINAGKAWLTVAQITDVIVEVFYRQHLELRKLCLLLMTDIVIALMTTNR